MSMQPFWRNVHHTIIQTLKPANMKKLYTILPILSIIIISTNVFGQEIPNAGFENWTPTLIWTIEPNGWGTDNTEVSAPVYPDSSAYSGELCMTLLPDVNGLGEGDAIAETVFDIEYIPEALEFYARWNFVIGAVGVDISFYNEEIEVISFNWQPSQDEPNSDWQLIQMPLNQIEPIFTHAIIRCYAIVGDLAFATISIDDMQFGVLNGIHDIDNPIVSIGPNPVSENLNINLKEGHFANTEMQILDAQGKVMYHGSLTPNLSVSSYPEGMYFLRIRQEDTYFNEKFSVIK